VLHHNEIYRSITPGDQFRGFIKKIHANTNIDEFMAEGFTEFKLSDNPSKYAIKIGELINKYFKK
jgi:hypothetical protein